jgi:hypothetical protein
MTKPIQAMAVPVRWKKAGVILAVLAAMLLLLTPSVLLWMRQPSDLGLAVIAITFLGMVFIFIRKYRKFRNKKF